MKKTVLSKAAALLVLLSMAAGLCSCGTKAAAADLMSGVTAGTAAQRPADDTFVSSQADFAIRLFALTDSAGGSVNSLVSPLSVMLALAMTANGAKGDTLTEMEKVLGEDISLPLLNEYLHTYISALPSGDKCRLVAADSIWLKDSSSLKVESDFLQKNADYYGAGAFRSPFNDKTVTEINSWVKEKTDGMIDGIISQIDDSAVMFLINALYFDALWQDVYTAQNVTDGKFTSAGGESQKAGYMHSTETGYIEMTGATGFLKPYCGGSYSFAALLPDEGTDIDTFISSLTGSGFVSAIKQAQDSGYSVIASLPKFTVNYETSLNKTLYDMGIQTAFDADKADFSALGRSETGNIYIANVLHKTYIDVNENGTRAAAVTSVEMACGSTMAQFKTVELNRPFVYAIVDNETCLPVFIGSLRSLSQ